MQKRGERGERGEKGKKGQVAIFVILAIMIVAAIVSIYLFKDKIGIISGEEFNPSAFLKSCIEPEAQNAIDLLSSQGGYSNPEGFVLYENRKVKYLCYASQNYKTCSVQQPALIKHFQEEMDSILTEKAKQCVANLKTEYEKRNFVVTLNGNTGINTSINTNAISIGFISPMTISKAGEVRNFDGFTANIESKLYEILSIAENIIDYEAVYGDTDTNALTLLYKDEIIRKTKLGDGTKIYKITNVLTDESFTFASRSVVWPPGYGII